MRYLSVCSGIEAASVAWHPLDRELEIAEVHDLLVGTVRLRQLRDIIERGEHRREEEK